MALYVFYTDELESEEERNYKIVQKKQEQQREEEEETKIYCICAQPTTEEE